MKTKFFSPRLYWEKMRQLRTVGFVSMVLCSLLLLLYMLKFLPSRDKYSITLVGDLAYYTEPLQFSLLRYLPVIILLTVALITCTVVTLLYYIGRGKLYIFGGASIALGVSSLGIELLLANTFDVAFIGWSVYPLIVLVLLGSVLIYLGRNSTAREMMERKLFL